MSINLLYKILDSTRKRVVLCVAALFFISVAALGQKTWDGGAGTLSWADANNWNPNVVPGAGETVLFNTATTLIIINVPSVSIAKLHITNNTNITLRPPTTNSRTLTVTSASNDAIIVESGSELVITGRDAGTDRTLTLTTTNTAGLEASITGTIRVGLENSQTGASGSFTKGNNAVIRFNSGSVYEHGVDGGTIPAATWNAASSCNITGIRTNVPNGFNQTFGDVNINCGSISGVRTLSSSAAVTIQGNLTLTGTSAGNTITLNPSNRNFIVNGTTTINNYGILNDNSGGGTNRFDQLLTINANGQFTNSNNPAFEFRGGITNNGTFSTGTGTFTFTTSDQQLTGTFSIPNITVTGITLTNNNTLTVSTALSGTGGLTQSTNATLNIGGTSGITTLTASASGNTVNYSGAAQSIKAASYRNFTISGSGNKTMQGDVTADQTATFTAGALLLNGYTLNLNSAVTTGAATITGSAASKLNVTGNDTPAITLPNITAGLQNMTINKTGATNTVTLGGSLSIGGALTLTAGELSIGANTLTLSNSSSFSHTSGTLRGGATSNLTVGTGSDISLCAITGVLNNLSSSRNISLGSDVTVNGTLTLTSGALSIGSNTLSLANSSTLTYSGGTLTGGLSSNLTIGTGTGITLNAISGGLNNFTSSRNITQGASLSLNGTLTLTAGSFTVGAYTLTLNGPAIAGTPASMVTSAASLLVFGGSASGVAIPSSVANLHSLTINNSNGVAMNSNITLAAGGVLTLTSGILDAGTRILKLNNTSAASALVWTSGSFVNVTSGGIERSLASGLSASGNNYLFPVGEGGLYKGIIMKDVTTGATGPVLRVTVSTTGALDADGTTLALVYPRYWSVANINSGNFTSTIVEIFESDLDGTKVVGMSSAIAGNYASTGGSSGAQSAVSETISSPAAYFCIGKIPATYYSYQTGDWNTVSTWTTDPSGTLQSGNSIPGLNEKVVILQDRTVTLPDDISTQGLDITIEEGGFLDMSNRRFSSTLRRLAGQGTLKLASVNFPSATTNTFCNAGGGTTEYYNSSDFTLPASQATYNNLTINAPGSIATQLSSITLNGNLYIKGGTLRINDNTSTTKLTLEINGNLTVDNGAAVSVGQGVTNGTIGGTGGTAPFLNYYLNFHTVIIRGNLTNNGNIRFTNLDYPIYNAFPPIIAGPTSGAASVYFQGSADNNVTCAGITDFYNLVIDKGSDQTYRLTINSSDYHNFRIFGANSMATDGAVTLNPDLRKALWIRNGTMVLTGSLIIPSLTEGTAGTADYYIASNGALIADGVDVVVLTTADDYRELNTGYSVSSPDNGSAGITKGGASALTVFGKLQLNNGFISTRESGGLITSSLASGQIIINGGSFDAKQLLSSSGSASYTQTGGLFVLRGRLQRQPSSYSSVSDLTDLSTATLNTSRASNGINSAYGSFNLENTANIYAVSGGTLRIYDVTGTGAGEEEAFDVKSSAANINVTGGTLEIIPVTGSVMADASYFKIYSTAQVNNLTIGNLSSASAAALNYSLIVLNDLNLASGSLISNNNDLSVGGDFYLESGTTYTPGNNTTTLNGSTDQTFTINQASALSLYKFTVDKTAGLKVTLAGTQGTLNVSNNLRLVTGTLDLADKTINAGGDLYNSGVHTGTGKIVLNGSATQTIDGNGSFRNIELDNNNAAAAPVSLLADMTVNGTLTFSRDKLFNISTYNLTLNENATLVNGSASRYIQTAGNSGDGGVTKVYSTRDPFTFHFGAPTLIPVRAVKYTPATIGFTQDPSGFGSVTIIPVGYEHPGTTENGRSLTYFWRVKSSGFTGIAANSVTHEFIYSENDVVGTESNYTPVLYTRNDFTWRAGTNANPPIDNGANIITDWTTPSNSKDYLDADYTAGDAAFGSPLVFYSIASSAWNLNSTWSYSSGGGAVPAGSTEGVNYPGPNSIVVIEDDRTVNLTANHSCASLQIEAGSVLDIYTWSGSIFSMVQSYPSGNNGLFRLTTIVGTPKVFSFPASSDFSDFNNNSGTTEFYDIDGATGAQYILPPSVNTYGNLILRAKGGDNLILPNNSYTTIKGDLTVTGDNPDAWVTMSWLTNIVYTPVVEKTVRVTGNMYINNGTFLFLDDQAPQHLIVEGDVTIAPGAVFDTYNGYPVDNGTNPRQNSFEIGGSFINNSNRNPSARFKNGNNYVNLSFSGNNNAFITSTGGAVPVTVLNNVTVNKGTSQTTTLTCNIGGTLTTPSDNWLTLMNGTFIYNRTGNFTISKSTDFTIPATSGLTLNTPSNVYIADDATNNKTLFLNGKLTIMTGGGNVYIGPSGNVANNADIEYSGSGASAIEVQGGNLIVNGQIRRPLASTNGVLTYSQSGGNVIVFGNNHTATKAKLEVLNPGSGFTMSNGTLTIVTGGGTTFGDLYLRPATGSVTGGTILFTQTPSAGPAIDASQSYTLDANIPLNSITITGKTTGTARDALVNLLISPLDLNGSLTLSNVRSTFNSNNLNLSLKGNLSNNGTYTYGTNTTTFNGSTQTISGTSVTNFYDLDVASLVSLTISRNLAIDRNLYVRSGILVLNSYLVSLSGDLLNDGTYTDDNSTGGIALSGSSLQQLSGTGSFGRLQINNSSGARLNSDVNLQNNLVMTQGVFDINHFQLSLGQNSSISGGTFGSLKMIKSDGVTSSPGIRKFLNAGSQLFTFPVGVAGKYTPAIFDISASTTVGFIRVNPISSGHVSVTDPANVLNYYWQLESSGIAGFAADLLLQYAPADVNGTESNYVAAKLAQPGTTWAEAPNGPTTDNVDETNHQISFVFAETNNLNGDYTAGTSTAIPGEVPSYQSNKDGNWSDPSVWTPLGESPPCPPGGPRGSIVSVNHVVTTDVNRIYVYSTTINGRLRVVSSTFGHNLGGVSGSGTLYLETGNLPGGNYSSFTNCTGNGTIEYGGTGTYTIIATQFSSLPNISFTGTGTRILPNKDLTICKSLVIDGPTLDNSVNNRRLIINGSLERYNSGVFTSGSGIYPLATVTLSGSALQTLGGPDGDFSGTSKFYNLEINNSAGVEIGSGGTVEVSNQLLLTQGIVQTTSSSTLSLLSTSSSAVSPTGGTLTSYINGPLKKQIVNGGSFLYPIGKGAAKSHDFTLTSSAGSTLQWTAEYFTPNGTSEDVALPLLVSNANEYWSVSTTTSASAKVRIAWDALSYLTPLMTENGLSDIRLAEFIGAEWNEAATTASGDNSTGYVENSGTTTISTTPKNFTTAAITYVKPRASFSSTQPVCGTAGIPITFTSYNPINLNYTLTYTIDGAAQPLVNVTSLPFTLPTASPGIYRLTGFTYNNGNDTGVVDASPVSVYANPTQADAGSNQSLCGVSGTLLEGNNPAPYSGQWTIVSGTGGTFVNSTTYNTVFTGVLNETYQLRWTITNASCSTADEVLISFPVAAAMPGNFTSAPATVCQATGGYVYTVPNVSGNTYSWTYDGSGETISGSGNSVTISFDASATSGTLSVTATNDCGTSSERTINITVNPTPVATFSYTGNPYCPTAVNPLPAFSGGGWAGTFSSTAGLVFANSSTGEVNLLASTPGTYTVTNTIAPAGGCSMTTATNSFTITTDQSWTGSVNTDWNVAGNWSCGFVPLITSNIIIPDVANEPVLSSGAPGTARNILIEAGSSLVISGHKINISGTIENNGSFTFTNGVVEMNGSSAQVIGADSFTGNSIKDLIVNNPAGVTLEGPLNVSGSLLVSAGTLYTGGYLSLISTATGTAFIDGSGNGEVSGEVTMQRYLSSAYGYKYFSSPFQSATVSEFADDINLGAAFTTFYKYDESRTSSGWVNYKLGTNLLFPMTGYAVNFGSDPAAKTADIKGEVNNGNLSVTLYNNNRTYTQGFNLVGNPYPSPIDWKAASGWTKTNIDDAIYLFATSTDDQYVGSYTTYINGHSSDGLASNIIPAMQGFFVHVSALGPPWPVTGTLEMTNSVRTTDLNRTFIKGGKSTESLVRLTATSSENKNKKDYFVIYYDEKADLEFDSQLDALKIFNTDLKVPNLYGVTPGGSKQSISGVSYTSEKDFYMPLGLKVNKAGTIEFSIEDVDGIYKDMRIFILDKLTGTEQELGKNNDYSVSLAIGEYLNRFYLNFYGSSTGLPDPQAVSSSIFNIYSYQGTLKGEINTITGNNGTLIITNLLGQKVYETEILEAGYFELSPGLKDGIYIATYTSGNFRSSKKLLMKN